MPVKGEVKHNLGETVSFELPDPKQAGDMTTGRLQIKPNVWRHIVWAPSHIIGEGNGAGRAYLKRERVGQPLSTVNLPRTGSTGILTDPDTGVTITLTRTK